MKLGFEEAQTPYASGSQSARVWTEQWVGRQVFCPNCANARLDKFQNNRPVADFICTSCREEYELKSQKSKFGRKIVDGAYRTMSGRLKDSNNPNFPFLNYSLVHFGVVNLFVIPKHFVVPEIIERRKPLAPTARRAGWIGCNILLNQIPDSGKILIGRPEFELEDVYAFEDRLSSIYPDNNNVRPKIRQQLQVLRDNGYLEFISRGPLSPYRLGLKNCSRAVAANQNSECTHVRQFRCRTLRWPHSLENSRQYRARP